MSAPPRWLLPISVVTWLIAFAVVVQVQSWLLLLGVAPLLATLRLALDPGARTLLRPTLTHVGVGLACGAMMAGLTHALYRAAVTLLPALGAHTTRLYALMGTTGHEGIILAALITVVVLGEEITFRAQLPWGAGIRGVVLTSGLYAGAHLTSQDPLLVVVAFACGLVWTGLRAISGSLVPSLLVHLVWDLVVLVLAPLPH